jgi:hypothetical protein
MPAIQTLTTKITSTPPSVRFVNHPRPDIVVDFDVFSNVDCPPDKYGFRRCSNESPLATLDCDQLRKPSDLLGGLEPSYPIALCFVEPYRNTDKPGDANAQAIAESNYFYNAGGVYPMYVRYIVFRNGRFHLIKTENEFRDTFAPIETVNEALSYILAVKDLSAYYDLEPNSKYEYFVDMIEDTHVDMVVDGYLVNLYHYEVFGCGPHITYAVDLHITTQGYIKEIKREAVYKNPAEDDLCVD